MIKIDQNNLSVSQRSPTFAEKVIMRQREIMSRYVMLGEMMESEILDECFATFIGSVSITSKSEAFWLLGNVSALELSEYFDFEYVRVWRIGGTGT